MEWLRNWALDHGRVALVPSTEDEPDSVWVVEDDAPSAIPGYYERKRIPLKHQLVKDGNGARFEFSRDGVFYRICANHVGAIQDVLETLSWWIAQNIVSSWDQALELFVVEENSWWRVLRLPPDASRDEIEEGYKRQSLKVHPDHGGDHETFLRVRKAYEEAIAKAEPPP